MARPALRHRVWVGYDTLSVFQPELVLPEQIRPRGADCPERNLAAAVYADAVALIRRHVRAKDAVREEALAWVQSDDRAWPYSFLNLSTILGLDAQAVRERLLRTPDADGFTRRPWTRSIVGYVPQPRWPRSCRDRARKLRRDREQRRARVAARRRASSSDTSSND